MTSSSTSSENQEFYALFERCNYTELYQLARRAGHNVTPNMPQEALIRILINDQPAPATPHEIDLWRRAIMRFLIDHRRMLETQIECPARSFKEDACFGCVDMQVVHCLTSNGQENFRLIELRKKAL